MIRTHAGVRPPPRPAFRCHESKLLWSEGVADVEVLSTAPSIIRTTTHTRVRVVAHVCLREREIKQDCVPVVFECL